MGWLLALVLLLATFVDYAAEVWLPGWRPKLSAGEAFGIDVSAYQGQIDWAQVRESGIRFAYVKATEGTTFTDAEYAANVRGAAAANVVVGSYAFFSFCSSGADQARHFLSVTAQDPRRGLPPAVDLELAGNCSARPTAAEVTLQLEAYVKVIGPRIVFYVGSDFASLYGSVLSGSAPRWTRSIYRRPSGDWLIWQASSRSIVPGITGKVDLDVATLTVDDSSTT